MKIGKKVLAYILTLALLAGMVPGVSLTAYAAVHTDEESVLEISVTENMNTSESMCNAINTALSGRNEKDITILKFTDGSGYLLGAKDDYYSWKHAAFLDDLLPNLTTLALSEFKGAFDEYAFSNCTVIIAVKLPANAAVSASMFNTCTGLTTVGDTTGVVDLSGCTSFGNNAFYGCASITSVKLPENAAVSDYMFSGCTKLKAIALPDTAPVSFNDDAFYSVSNPMWIINDSVKKDYTIPTANAPTGAALPTVTGGGTVNLGAVLTLSVAPDISASTAPVTYQWKKDDTSINGATNRAYTKTATTADSGKYTCEVSLAGTTYTTDDVTVTVNCALIVEFITTDPGDGQVTLIWDAPADDGGSTIIGYDVSKDNGANWNRLLADSRDYTYTGLTNGMKYTFKIRAVTNEGYGDETTINATAQASATGTPNTSWYKSGVANFNISNADQLAGLAQLVNKGITFAGKTISLNNDINLSAYGSSYNSGKGWTPIGYYSYGGPRGFCGTFNGGGHKITGMYINKADSYSGLFGYIHNSSIVKNLGVDDANISGNFWVGGIVGYLDGWNGACSISGCYFTGSISGCMGVGGIVGYSDVGSVTNCYSTGNIRGEDSVGGIAGMFRCSSSMSNCYSTGDVTGFTNIRNKSYGIGGVAGAVYSDAIIENCYSTGNVSGDEYVGGIVGEILIRSVMRNCAALNPSVVGSSDTGRVAGCVDNESGAAATNCAGWDGMACNSIGGRYGFSYNGASISKEYIHSDGSIGSRFVGASWTTEDGKLPGLFGQAVDMPEHLKTTAVVTTFTITASAGTGGSISPSGIVTVLSGHSQTFTITAEIGYQINDVKVNNISQGAISEYIFNSVTNSHTIYATFVETTVPDTLITSSAITGVTSPVANATPSTTINNGTGFTASLSWNGNPAIFGYNTGYTATITLKASRGYTFKGNFANTAQITGFTVNNNAPQWVSNDGTTLVFMVTFPATANAPIIGDVNGDGKVEMDDLICFAKHIAEIEIIDSKLIILADINGDGKINIADLIFLSRWLAGYDDKTLLGKPKI